MSKDIVRLLLVEDSPSDARLLCEALRDYPLQRFEIELAQRLDEAIALLAQKPFDVILLDLNLPDSSGKETCRRMSRAAGQVPIIVLTGADDEAVAGEAMYAGVQDYLVKGAAYGSAIGRTIRYTVERSQFQQALREAEERLHRAMESGKVGTWEWEVGTEDMEWSQGVYMLLGYEPGAVKPTRTALRQRIHSQDLAREDQALKDSLERCEDYLCEFRIVWTDGSVPWVEARGQYVYLTGENGTAILRMRGVLSDIDRRKQAEEALRESMEKYRTLFDSIDQGFCIIEVIFDGDSQPADYRFLEVNPAFERQTGLHEAQGKRMREMAPDHEAHWFETYGRIALTGEPARFTNEARALQRWYDVYAFRIGEPQARRVAILFNDITERRQTEEALRGLTATLESKVTQRTAELKHRTRQLQKLALDMSEAEDRERERIAQILHDDLQQELAAAKFHLGLVRSRVKNDPSVQEIVAEVNEMLKDAIGKSRSLSHELSPAVLRQDDFGAILHGLAGEVHDKHGLTVQVQGRARVQSDPIRAFLYRTAQELLFNAVKHAQVKEARVRVRQWGGCICLAVSDRGRGFDPERLREAAGFGLLSIRERIELLGGRMNIRSAPGQGSTFFVVVPDGEGVVGSRTSVVGEEEGRAGHRLPATDYRQPLRVVLVDDHDIVRQGLAALLSEEETIEVIGEATNGREAVELADRFRPDVVLMDVSMPVMSGEEATRQIKQDLPQTRIVSLSMREEPEVRERMHQAGAESYVLKTAPYKELLSAIRGPK